MNKQEFIKDVIASYPAWQDDEHIVKLKARGLKRLIEQAFDEGFQHAHNLRGEKEKHGLENLMKWMKKLKHTPTEKRSCAESKRLNGADCSSAYW